MKKTKMTTKVLSMLLTAIMLFTTVSVGIIVPDAKIEAAAAEVVRICKSNDHIRDAITYANSNPSDKVIIRLGQTITNDSGNGGGAVAKFAAITGNVVIDLYGCDLAFIHSKSSKYTSQQFGVQLPSENAVNNVWHVDNDTVPNSMFEVAVGGTLQIINTQTANSRMIVNTRLESTAYKDGNNSHQTSSSLIKCKGTLILGDKDNSLNNNFTLYSYSAVLNSSTSGGGNAGGSHNGANASSFAVTVDDSNAVFKMYGGGIQAAGDIQFRREATSYLIAIALNIKNCKSAEIYGGSVDVPSFSIRNNMDWLNQNANSGNRYVATAIRCSSPYLYIFDVDSTVKATSGNETDDSDNLYIYLSNIHSTSDANAAHVYGGYYYYSATRPDENNTALINAAIARGAYKVASAGNINPSSISGSDYLSQNCGEKTTLSNSLNLYTVFLGDAGTAENGLDMFSYNTFCDYLAQYKSTALDVYYGNAIMTTNGDAAQEVGSTNYLRNGYTHKNWQGKTHPGVAYNTNYKTPASAAITGGGSLYLSPLWEENVYTITHDWNDSDGASKVTDTTTCPVTYKITSTSTLGEPVRPGYTFKGWAVTAASYPDTDTKKNVWDIGAVLPSGYKLNGKNGNITLQAQWEVVPYTATISLNGGNIAGDYSDITKSYNVNKVFQFPQGVRKDFYDFTGYFKVTKADGSWAANETLYAAGSTSELGSYGNPTFEAQFKPIEYTITYDSSLGSSVDDETAKVYTVTSEKTLPAITRTGYEFSGWYIEDANSLVGNTSWIGGMTKDVNGNNVPVKLYPEGTSLKGKHGNVTLKAHWTSSKYKLNLDIKETEGEVFTGAIEYTYAYSSPIELGVPEKPGYDFIGWKVQEPANGNWLDGEEKGEFKAEAPNTPVTIPANKIGSVTLEAMWQKITYTITFDSNGGQGCADITFDIEKTFTLPATTKKGYVFTGWSVSVNNEGNWTGGIYTAGQAISGKYGDVTLRANWDRETYTITLDANGGTVNPGTLNYNYENPASLPVPQKTGYDFNGWKIKEVGSDASWEIGTEYTDTLPAGQYGTATLEAQWIASEYNIHFVSTGTTPTDIKYHINDEKFNVPASSYPGYKFLYWNVTAPVGNWTQNEKIYTDTDITGKYGHVTLNANFEVIPFTITYKDVDGTETVVNYDMRTPVTIPTYERAGYIFGGWKVESLSDGSGWVGTYQPGDYTAGERYGNVILVPDVTPIGYEITFIPDGGTPYANLSYDITSEEKLPTPEKTGYNFIGWKVTLANGAWTDGEIIDGEEAVTGRYGDVTLTAQWAPKKYTITWITGSGTFETEAEYDTIPDFSTINTDKAADAQYSYTFKGWSPALSAVKGEATYTAQYDKTVNKYTVTWQYLATDADGAQVTVTTEQYEYGAHPVFNSGVNPEKTSVSGKYYRFIGWKDANGNDYSEATTVLGDITYIAQFKEVAAPRTVTWIIDGVRYETKWGVEETPEYAGTPIKADANGMKYTFTGWDKPIVAVEAGKDYEYVAQFTESAQSYKATFDANGGAITGNTEVTYNKVDGLKMPVPEKTGYTFMGWKVVSNSGTWTQTGLLTSTNYGGFWGNVSFKAEFVATEYTIKVEADDGTTPEYKYTIESEDTLPGLTKEGFVLTGWTVVSADGNWIAGDNVAPDKQLSGMYGNVTIHPLWTAKLYKINWVSGDTVQTVEFKFGEATVAYPPISKPGYTAAWDRTVPSVMPAEDLTFTAVYSPIQYYLRFNSAGGSAVENFYYDITSNGALPTPTRDGASFIGWKVSAGNGSWEKDKVYAGGTLLKGHYGNITLTAVWKIQTHKVIWVAGDVTKVSEWYHGATPSFDGVPYKSSDDYYSYEFIGWDKEIVVVTEDVTYTALFRETARKYIIKWNVDGHIVEEKQYFYGETPKFNGLTPTRPSTSEFDFTFAGWSPVVSAVTGDITYVAVFDVFTKLQGLRVDKTAVFLNIGDTAIVSAIISPVTASSKDVSWISSNTSVAEIDENGRITAIGAGETLIRVESKDGQFKSYCVVSVAPVVTEFIVVSAGGLSTTRLPGESIYLSATVMPDNATNKTVTWSTSDPAIATVDQTGLVVFGDKIGTATITAVADGYAKGSIEVTTTEVAEDVEDNVKTYMVMFMQSTSTYVINGVTYEAVSIILKEGETIEFTLTEPHFVTLNGIQYERDTDGVYRIENIDNNYTVMSVERPDIGFEDDSNDDNNGEKKSFFDKLKEFFQKIIDFFKNLFG